MNDKTARVMPIEEHIQAAVRLMKAGARMHLESVPDDPTTPSAIFTPETCKAIAQIIETTDAYVKRMIPARPTRPHVPLSDVTPGYWCIYTDRGYSIIEVANHVSTLGYPDRRVFTMTGNDHIYSIDDLEPDQVYGPVLLDNLKGV